VTSRAHYQSLCAQNLSSCWAELTFGSGPIVVGDIAAVHPPSLYVSLSLTVSLSLSLSFSLSVSLSISLSPSL
jgi:hypothetical protein